MKWYKVEDEASSADYYRDTLGGRQHITRVENSKWELTQEGYFSPLASGDAEAVQIVADELADVQHLRIANMDAFEFCKALYFTGARAIKSLVSGDTDRAEEGLKDVAQLEAYALVLRERLSDRVAFQSIASRAEQVSADMRKNVNNFYGELGFGYYDHAQQKLDALVDQVGEMQQELNEETGDPKDRS